MRNHLTRQFSHFPSRGTALLGIALLVVISGCTSSPYPTGSDAALVDKTLVTGEVCEPPCWQGITPGESNAIELIAFLRTAPFVDSSSISRLPQYGSPEKTVVKWSSSISERTNHSALIDDHHTVTLISIVPEYELTLQEMFDLFGEPDTFRIQSPTKSLHAVSLVWLSAGLSAEFGIRRPPNRPLLEPQSLLGAITYFAPVSSVEQYQVDVFSSSRFSAASYQPWDGFEAVVSSTVYESD